MGPDRRRNSVADGPGPDIAADAQAVDQIDLRRLAPYALLVRDAVAELVQWLEISASPADLSASGA